MLEELKVALGGQEGSQRPIDEIINVMRASIDSLEETVKLLEDKCKFYMRIDEENSSNEPKLGPIKYHNAPILSNLANLVERIRTINRILGDITNRLV